MQVAKYGEFCDSKSAINESSVLRNGPELRPTKRSKKVCKKPLDTTIGVGARCDKLPLFALTYEMNFVYNFTIDSQKRPMMGDDVNEGVAKNKYALLRSDFPKNEDTFGIIKGFANNQQLWAQEFFNGWEKLQNNVDNLDELKEDPTTTSWLGHSFFKTGRYQSMEL